MNDQLKQVQFIECEHQAISYSNTHYLEDGIQIHKSTKGAVTYRKSSHD